MRDAKADTRRTVVSVMWSWEETASIRQRGPLKAFMMLICCDVDQVFRRKVAKGGIGALRFSKDRHETKSLFFSQVVWMKFDLENKVFW